MIKIVKASVNAEQRKPGKPGMWFNLNILYQIYF